jgi:hypothetical protein
MMLRAGIAVAAVALAAGSASAAPSHSPVCGPARAKTVAATRTARIYRSAHWVYGCASGSARAYRLGQQPTCIGAPRVGPVVLAGELAGFGSQHCGVDSASAEVVVRRLTDGQTLTRLPATTTSVGAESFDSVASLVLKRDGAVAWIGVNRSIISKNLSIEVHRHDRTGSALLDSGASIRTTSLRRHGSLLTWRHGGELRHARLS